MASSREILQAKLDRVPADRVLKLTAANIANQCELRVIKRQRVSNCTARYAWSQTRSVGRRRSSSMEWTFTAAACAPCQLSQVPKDEIKSRIRVTILDGCSLVELDVLPRLMSKVLESYYTTGRGP